MFLDPKPPRDTIVTDYQNKLPESSDLHFPGAKRNDRRAMVRAALVSRYIWHKDAIDIGCGGGFMVEAMRRFRARAVGVDINPQRIAYAAQHFPKNQFFCESLEEFPLRNLTFDFVYSSRVLEHLYDVNEFMNVLTRMTRPSKFVLVRTPNRDHWRRPDLATDLASARGPSPPAWVHFFTKTSLRILFEKHGFEVRSTSLNIKHYLNFLAQRK